MNATRHNPQATDKPLCIAWLLRGDESYGVRRMVLSLIEGVHAHGHQAVVVCLSHDAMAEPCAALGAHVRTLAADEPPAFTGPLLAKACGVWALCRYERRMCDDVVSLLRDCDVDAVHVLWPNLVGFAGQVAAALGAPCFWENPNEVGADAPRSLSRWYYQWLCWRHQITALSISGYTAGCLGHWPVRAHVVHLGANAARFDPDAVEPIARAEIGVPDEALVLGVFARLTPTKGQDRVLRAMIELVGDGADLHLLLLGGGGESGYIASLQALAASHGASGRLHHLGQVADPERYYGAIDVAINSRVDPEPFGLSVVEAMMMARPVAVHALGGPAETVVDGQTGWHVTDPSPAGWAAALRRVLADRPRWPAMGEAARQRARRHFTIQAQTQRYLSILHRVRGAEAPPPEGTR